MGKKISINSGNAIKYPMQAKRNYAKMNLTDSLKN